MTFDIGRTRSIRVPMNAHGQRLDRFLSERFGSWSRNALSKCIKDGLVTNACGDPMRPSKVVHAGQVLEIAIPGLAPTVPPPECPPIVYEDNNIIALNKPPGLVVHPVGDAFKWSVMAVARMHWPNHHIDLAHRIDRDTSGLILLTKNKIANKYLKSAFRIGSVRKTYTAICKGRVAWSVRNINACIGPEQKAIRVKQAIRTDGLSAHTRVEVTGTRDGLTRVHCSIETGRNHQIRVHLNHAGLPILGDRLYGVPDDIFLHSLEHGADTWVREQTGAPRHALHCHALRFPQVDGRIVELNTPLYQDMARWWSDPQVLPHDAI